MSTLSEKNGITPIIWGPYFWRTFHTVAFGYPDTPDKIDKTSYQAFYENFTRVLPCDTCSLSAQRNILKTDWEYILSSRERLIRWTYDFHEEVNKKLNKKSPTFEVFKDNLLNPEEGCNNLNYKIIIAFLVLLCIYLLLF